ncbi:cytochrome c maturation protein CcmE [Alphaproteobacteria bacterium]|nr:cytochrome c maturation protein CcmE [Alphaproteobacteria bacterium]
MKPKYKRLIILAVILIILGTATQLILFALKDNIVYFYSPNDLKLKYGSTQNIKETIRVGGLVLEGSVTKKNDMAIFTITDKKHVIKVIYDGALPDLFREGQGIVAEGKVIENNLIADQVLAKHDENYMPPEVADALIKNGVWQGEVRN